VHNGSRMFKGESPAFRPDLEGLRAVAVLLVVLAHLFEWPAGGFIGVDVFFVISGFLITGLMLDESRFSLRRFYARRARRILPAALAVLAAVVIAAHLVFRGARVVQTTKDVAWALGFSVNIHFARIGTDYFQANRAPSLVQHFWSLAVEEQFYLVWPVVLVAVVAVAGRRALLPVVAAASVASFAYAVHAAASPATYFSTAARAWELGVGALLAIAVRARPRARSKRSPAHRRASPTHTLATSTRGLVGLLGLAGIIIGAFIVPSVGFPAAWVAVPVVSTAAVIAAGGAGRLLTNPLSRYVGRLSYSLYLWHWPVILVVAALVPHPWPLKYAMAIFAMVGLSIASYHLVEVPIRRRQLPFPADAWRPALAAVACLAAVALLSVLIPGKQPPSFATDAPTGLATTGPDVAHPHRALATAIDHALSATSFPRFDPPLDTLGGARGHWRSCDGATDLAGCTFGSQAADARIAVVIGDSVAMSWLPGIDAALAGGNWRIYGLTLEACPAAHLSVRNARGGASPGCDQRHGWVEREALRLHPQLVILASTDSTLSRVADGAKGAQASAEYQAALQHTITTLQPGPHRRVLTLSPPPPANDLSLCDTAGSTPAACVRRITDRWISFARAERAAAEATQTSYIDTHLWFCNRAGYCPAFVGSTAVRWDSEHVNDVYARSLAGEIRGVIDVAIKA
jgi:peptidoglycan/LPS O-acetylase OafA/YrhL